jgi:hypothetical protein
MSTAQASASSPRSGIAARSLRRASDTPLLLLSLPLLGISRLLPAHGLWLWVRLVAATLVLFLPGALLATALGVAGAAAATAWTLAALIVGLAVVFAVHSSIWVALAVMGAVAAAALPFAFRVRPGRPGADKLAVALAGLVFGALLWHAAGALHGDELFHLGRVRKLDAFGSLHLRTLDEFRDGGLHPGYAFPLWHGLVALVARLAGVDPAVAVLHAPSTLAPLAFLIAYEAGVALFRTAWLGLAVLAASVGRAALAPGHGGGFVDLALPATADRYVLAPAVIALFVAHVREPTWRLAGSIAAAAGAASFIHPTSALFISIPLGGFAVARLLLARTDARSLASALAALAVPVAAVFLWIAPLVRETAAHDPSKAELGRGLRRFATEIDVDTLHHYRLAPEVVSRTGALAVAALVLVPLAALAARRRWSALVLGGSLAVLALELVKWIFPRFADVVSLSQARRAAGYVPFAYALAGGAAVLAALTRAVVLPLALGAGIVLQRLYPGDFGGFDHGGPAIATWIAAFGGAAAVAVGLVLRRAFDDRGILAGLAAFLFVVPVAVHGVRAWSPAVKSDPYALSAGLLDSLRTEVPKGAVVFSDLATSYEIEAYTPLYVAAAPPAHVANTRANDPYGRRQAVMRFFAHGDLRIPRALGAGWLVVDRSRFQLRLRLPVRYEDRRFALYRLEH